MPRVLGEGDLRRQGRDPAASEGPLTILGSSSRPRSPRSRLGEAVLAEAVDHRLGSRLGARRPVCRCCRRPRRSVLAAGQAVAELGLGVFGRSSAAGRSDRPVAPPPGIQPSAAARRCAGAGPDRSDWRPWQLLAGIDAGGRVQALQADLGRRQFGARPAAAPGRIPPSPRAIATSAGAMALIVLSRIDYPQFPGSDPSVTTLSGKAAGTASQAAPWALLLSGATSSTLLA